MIRPFTEGLIDAHLRTSEQYAAVLEEHNRELKLEIIRLQMQVEELQRAAAPMAP